VAQRFSAAITGLFSESALAADVRLRRGKYFFRSLLGSVLPVRDKVWKENLFKSLKTRRDGCCSEVFDSCLCVTAEQPTVESNLLTLRIRDCLDIKLLRH